MSGKPHKIKERSILFALIKAIFKVICIWGGSMCSNRITVPMQLRDIWLSLGGCCSDAIPSGRKGKKKKKRKTTKRNSLGRFAQAFKKRLGSGSEPSTQGGLTSIPQHCKNHPRWPRPGLLSLGSGDKGTKKFKVILGCTVLPKSMLVLCSSVDGLFFPPNLPLPSF